jgi:amino acid adenylation domain-containing protein
VDVSQPFGRHSAGPINAFVEFHKEAVEGSIADRFQQQARKFPDRLAIKVNRDQLTYDQLDRVSNRVARAILAKRGDTTRAIALLFKQGVSMIIASLSALKAGKAYVQLDYSLPVPRARQITQDSDSGLIVTDNDRLSLAHELFPDSSRILNINNLDAAYPDNSLGLSISPNEIAYIHYTSGSTGEPKGVVANHRNELYSIMVKTNALRISSNDRISLLRSNNVGATADVLLALLNGAALFPLELKESGLANLGNWLIEEEITVFTCVAGVFRHCVNHLNENAKFSKLRLIHVGGEPVYETDVQLYKRHFSDECVFVNRLGISETKTVTYYFVNKETEVPGRIVPVGYPLDGYEVMVVDEYGNDAGINRIGEIVVKSEYLASGYWRRPELTRAKFLPDPNGGEARIYHTGDLGYLLPDGCLVHVGRKDFQVKIRGHRVEIPEIEMKLLENQAIREAVVIPWEDPRDAKTGNYLVAYVVPYQLQPKTITEIRSFLKERLPSYMLPSYFVIMDRLPLTTSGKIDRRALPPPIRSRNLLDTPYVAARTPLEKVLVKIWVEAMGIDEVGIHDDFSGLGGDSLIAAQIVSKVNDTFPLKVFLRLLFEAPTVAKLVQFIIEHESNPGQSDKIAEIILQIENMSAEQIRRSLKEERGNSGDG